MRSVVFLGRHKEIALFLIPEELRSKMKSILSKKSVQKQISLNYSYINRIWVENAFHKGHPSCNLAQLRFIKRSR